MTWNLHHRRGFQAHQPARCHGQKSFCQETQAPLQFNEGLRWPARPAWAAARAVPKNRAAKQGFPG
jgi:hypothetical protein